jgi:hypothetical protein
MRELVLVLLSAAALCAQSAPAVMEYTGKPLVVEGKCSAEAIHDLGLSCTIDEPCALYLELSDVQAVGDRLVVTGNLHTNTTTIESILLSSDDFGRTWSEAHARIPSAVLDRIQFYDFEAGWISGHLLQPLPRDAFFLITADGGKTWRKRMIFGETRPGAVELFWFDTRSHGLLLMDHPSAEDGMKHELWESMTAGDSWSVRQVDSKPIPLNRPAPSGALRIRADAKTQSQRVERQAGPKWDVVTSFRVSAGECKPPPPPAEAPPPETAVEPSDQPAPSKVPLSKRPPSLKPKRVK